MASILELAELSDAAYLTSAAIEWITADNWVPLKDASGQNVVMSGGANGVYYGAAYKNKVTGEIVITNRGTLPNKFSNLWADATLTAHVAPQAAFDARTFALLVAKNNPGATITETGHSLGGYEAEAGLAILVDSGVDPSATAVTFNAPGLTNTLFANKADPGSYNVLNLYNQGDVVHLAGGTHLGKTASIPAGPSPVSEFVDGALGFVAGELLGGLFGIPLSGALLAKDWLKAHVIGTSETYLLANRTSVGNLTAAGFIAAGNGFTPSPLLTSPGYGTLSLNNGLGDNFSLQSTTNGSITESVALGSDGAITPPSNVAALNAELAAEGVATIAENASPDAIVGLGGSTAIYATVSPTTNGTMAIIGPSPIGLSSGVPGEVSYLDNAPDARINFNAPSGAQQVTETIIGTTGAGSVWVDGNNHYTQLTGAPPAPTTPDTWALGGLTYTFAGTPDSPLGTLTITGALLGSNSANSIEIENFNLESAQSATGFMGIYLGGALFLNSTANAGVDAPAPDFQAGSNQSYTLSVDAPSTSAQTITVQLSGAPPSTFDASIGTTLLPINSDGTFSVVLPAGQTNISFALENLTGFAASNLSLSASMPNLSSPSGSPIAAPAISFEYLGAPSTSSIVADAMYGFNGSPGYFADYAAYVPGLLNLQRNASLVGATVALGTPTGDSFVWVNNANTSVVAAGDNDTILVEYGWPYGNGGTDIIVATGHHDVIENDSGLLGNSGPVQIFASGLESLGTAITAAQTGTGTGQQGDLIVGGSEANTTIVGSNGNDFITNASGNDVVVAGAGNDVIVGGVKSIYGLRYWGEFGENSLEAPDASLLGSFGWQATVTNGSLQMGGGIIDVGDYPGAIPDPAYPSTFVPAPANYEGNFDIYGNIVGLGNETIFGGTGASLILLSNGNNYVDMGPGNSTVRGGMGSNTVIGGSGAQFIVGGGGSDYLTAGSGNSTIGGNGGNNTIIGGSGVVLLEAGGGGPDFATVETGDNYVFGGSGSGTIFGSGAADTLIGGTGHYTIIGGAGLELITGGSGNDLLIGGSGSDTIDAGGSGADSLQANGSSSSTSYLYGGGGSDSINGGSGANIIYAGDGGVAGAATSVFASGSDASATTTIYGGLGVDQLVGGAGTAVIYAGDGGSSGAPTSVLAGSGATTMYGGIGTDYIQGGSGTDLIYAGDGGIGFAQTTVQAGSGASTIYGGAGSDLLQDISSGNVSMIAGTGDTTVIGSGSDSIQAGSGNELIQSNGGSITLQIDGAIGNDTVISNGGTVNLSFGTGVDSPAFTAFVEYDSSNRANLVLSGEGGQLVIEGGLTGTLGTINFADSGSMSVQQLVQSAGGDETLTGATGSLVFNVDTAAVVEGGTGGTGAVTVSAWGNNDTVFGGNSGQIDVTGSNTIVYDDFTVASSSTTATGANDTVQASQFGDNILISGANAVAIGGASNDTLMATGTNDTLVAGLGNDVFGINASTVIENPFGRGIDTIDSSISYTAPTGINALTLTGSANLVATGNSASDVLTGGAGADTLIAGSGVATLNGGSGNTTFVINNSSDVVRDFFSAANSIQSSVSFTLPDFVNLLTLTGTANLVGAANSDNDTLVSNSGIDTLIGGAGHDTFILNNASDVVQDSLGTATIIYQSSGSFSLPASVTTLTLIGTAAIHATGNSANDVITANTGADTLSAGNGNDTLISGSGIDSLIGGTGNDLFVVNNSADVVLDTSATATNSIQSSVNYTLPTNVNSLLLIGSGNITGTGNAVADVLTAGAGADTLIAGSAIDTLIAGTGNTTFVINNLGDVIRESSATSSNTVNSSVSYSLPTDINSLVLTGTSSLVGTANAANDSLTGNSGASTLIGGAGVDTLVAGAGVNTLVGGAGNTTFVLNNVADVVVDTSTTATNTAMSSVSYSLPTNVNNLILTGTAALTGIANNFSDELVGNAGADSLVAGSGFDILVAGSGADTLVAGSGPDYLIVNSAADVLQIGAGHGVVTVDASLNYTLPTNVSELQLTGTANLTGTGNGASGTIVGNSGRDSLISGAGFETLMAGLGIDTLIGNSAGDVFIVNNALDVVVPSVSVSNSVESSVNYTLPTNINSLTLIGPGNIVGTGNAATDGLVAGAGNDTLVPGTGAANMVGGGDTTYIVNNTSDQVQERFTNAQDTVRSAINFTLPNNVNTLLFTGTAALVGTANGGNDTLIANSGVDTLIGGAGNDTFVVGRAGEVIQDSSSGSSNTIDSSVSFSLLTNVNTLILTGSSNLVGTANSGADTLVANAGIDTLNGGSGNDVFVVDNVADVISDTSAAATNSLQTSVSYALPTNVNMLTLTGNANIVGTGNGAANTLIGSFGNDTLVAGAGLATLIGGTGNTTFVVNNASDVVQDTTTYSSNTIVSSVSFSAPINVNSLMLTGTTNLAATANAGNDTLISNSGVDTLTGGAGVSVFVVNNSADTVQDSAATASVIQSSVSFTLGANLNSLVLLGTSNLVGTANSANDTLTSNTGIDTLHGGSGNDTFVINNSADVVQDTSTAANNLALSSVSYTLPTNVNSLVLTGTANIAGQGNATNNTLTGGAGTDTLIAGSGLATLRGGTGNTTFVVNNVSDVVQDTQSGSNNTVQSSVSFSAPSNVNTLILTGTAGLKATANAGNDTLVSNSGLDTLVGGSGLDLFFINNAADVVSISGVFNDSIESSVSYSLQSNINTLILSGSSALVATANGSADSLYGNSGNDTFNAGAGVDTFIAGAGNNTFVVNNANDMIVDSFFAGSSSVQSSASFDLPANVDTLMFTGSSNLQGIGNLDSSNVLTANSGNDVLIGRAFANTINGGNGSDTIEAGPGSNLINSGNGGTAAAPTLVFGNASGTSISTQTTMYGGSGVNVLYGGPGSDVIYAGSGTSSLISGSGTDTLFGSASGQILQDSLSGNAVLVAGAGSETLYGTGADQMVAGSGNDLFVGTGNSGLTYELNSGFGQDSIFGGAGTIDNLVFGAGIEASAVTISAATDRDGNSESLRFSTGTSSVVVTNALLPGVIGSVTFADTGTESLSQLINADGPGLQSLGNLRLSTGNAKVINGDSTTGAIFAYGDNDSLTAYPDSPFTTTQTEQIYAYGNNNVITGGQNFDTIYAYGNDEVINPVGGNTVYAFGANDTIVAGSSFANGNDAIWISQGSTVIQASPGSGHNTVYSMASYTLPANIQNLVLEGSGAIGTSNAVGGMLTAWGASNTLIGGAGTDTLATQVGRGFNSLVGGPGTDTFIIGASTDSIQLGANPGHDSIESYVSYALPSGVNNLTLLNSDIIGTGNSGNDLITSLSSFDTVIAGSGNDTLVNGALMVGGSGTDTFVVGFTDAVIQESAVGTNSVIESSVSYTLPTNVNTLELTGSSYEVGAGNSANDLIIGDSGTDTLIAGSGSDTLIAGSGLDTLIAGSGSDTMQGNSLGGDTFVFNSGFGTDQITNAQNGDSIQFGAGITQSSLTFSAAAGVSGGAPSLVIVGGGGAITVQGGLAPGAIADISFTGGATLTVPQLIAPSGRVTITGSGGNLILSPNNNDTVTGGSGQDTIDTWGNNDSLTSGTGGALIYAGGNGDTVTGGSLNDTLVAMGSADTLIGGSGNETFVIESSDATVNVSAGVGHDTVLSSVSYTVPINVTLMTLTGAADIQGTGNAGNDTITANAGNDTLVAGSGIDTLIGGAGNDLFVVNSASDVVQNSFTATLDTIESSASYTLPTNVSTLVLSGTSNLVGTANGGADTLVGNAGNDTLVGGSGADSLASGTGNATLISGTGVDTLVANTTAGDNQDLFVINNSADVIQDSALLNPNESTVNSSVSYVLTASVGTFNLTGTSNLLAEDPGFFSGTAITGNSGNDTLIGFSDFDSLIGGGGVDTMEAGPTSAYTVYVVNNAADVIIGFAGQTNGMVNSSVSYTNPAHVDTMQLMTVGIVGTANNDSSVQILSLKGHDTLIAGSGNDTLESVSTNSDTMVSGTGNDSFSGYTGDLFEINAGFGVDTLYSGTAGTVRFGSGISAGNLTAQAAIGDFSSPSLRLTDGSSSLLLDFALSATTYQFNFNGGPNLSLGQLLSEVTVTTSSVAGASGNVILEGTASTSVAGGTGNDTIYAAAANDTITGGSGFQVLEALGANDSIVGGSSSDTLTGLGSNDTLVAGSAADTLIGGTGATVEFVINNTGDAIQLQTSPGADTLSSSVTYSLPTNVNTLILTGTAAIKGTANTGADTLTSNTALDTLVGGSGNDYFIINNASDVVQDTSTSAVNTIQSAFTYALPTDVNNLVLIGTAALTGTANNAADTLTSNTGVDTLIGGTGNDTFILNNAADVVQDTTTTSSNTVKAGFSYTLPTNINTLVLTGSGNLTGVANTGNDTLTSNTGTDTLIGGAGNETFIVNNTADVIQDTSTTATNSVQSSVSFTLATNVNSLTLTGTSALTGTANGGSDTLTSNIGIDTLVGGSGNDTFVINNSSDVIQDTSTTATNTAKSAVSYSLATNVNTLTLTGSSNLVGTANGGNDSITGNSGADTLIGGAGVDTLTAGTGIDTLIGGTGNTTFVINSASDVVQDTSASASNTLRSSVTYVLPTNVNALVLTGTSALKGTANGGNDTLTSNTGIDTLVGGPGNETFVISNASDVVQDTSGAATNIIQSSVAFTLPTNVNTLTFTGSTALHGTGNSGNDSMTANSGADTLSAGNGTDTLVSGTTGADSLVAGTGNDLFIVNFAGDIVTVGATHGTDTIQSSVSYTASPNVANFTLTGTAALTGTGSSTAIKITANSGTDTLTAGAGIATLVGGAGNDTFVINSASDVIQDTATTASNILSSSVSYTLPTNVNRLILTGTAALVGTANTANDTLTANTGADTLVSGAGSAVDSLVGGTGADLFVVNNASDIVTVGATHGVDTIQSSVSYTASANVANLTLIGTAAIAGTGNSLAGTLSANNANDTLTAGSGIDTLVGGTGTDLFIVNSSSDVVTLATSGTSDTIQSSASYTLPTNVQYLTLTGTGALSGTGNSLTDLIVGNSGADTLVGGTGIAVLEGGRTAGSDQIKALSNQAALIGGAAASTLTGGAFKDFYAAGTVSDSITTGATANVVSVNKGDGATALQPTTSATNVLSLGAGIDTESLFFTKTGNNLVLTDGVSGDSITFTNWYVGAANQNYTTLQVVEIASANYNSLGSDGLRNKALEAFNFTALVAAYNTAGSPANWALSTAMPTTQLSSSSTADYGGDLAYYFGLNGNLTGMDLSAAQSTLTNASFGTATQTIDAFAGISGGGGLHLAIAPPSQRLITPIRQPQILGGEDLGRAISPQGGIQLRPLAGSPSTNIATVSEPSAPGLSTNVNTAVTDSTLAVSLQVSVNKEYMKPILRLPDESALSGNFEWYARTQLDTARVISNGNLPQVRAGVSPAVSSIQIPVTSQAMVAGLTSELSGTVSAGQVSFIPAVTSADLANSIQPQMSSDEHFLRAIVPRISSPVRAGIAPATSTIDAPAMSIAMNQGTLTGNPGHPEVSATTNIVESQDGAAALGMNDTSLRRVISPGRLPQLLDMIEPTSARSPVASVQPALATPHTASTIAPVKIADIDAMLGSTETSPLVNPQAGINWSQGLPKNLVDPINVAWLTMHDAFDQSSPLPIGGSEASSDHNAGANDALLAGAPTGQIHRLPDELDIHSQQMRQRAV
jgi:Ca2+-binding RTX toxin-like protein